MKLFYIEVNGYFAMYVFVVRAPDATVAREHVDQIIAQEHVTRADRRFSHSDVTIEEIVDNGEEGIVFSSGYVE